MTTATTLSRRKPAIEGGGPLVNERFRFIQPALPPFADVVAGYRDCYERGMITNSSTVTRFEATVAERLGVAHCVAVSSCTSGLALTLRALGLQGEVILPSLTFFATGHAALWNGLEPVFADCDEQNWTVDPADVERKITDRTAAIIGVHLYGNPCDVEALERVAARHKLPLIFDSAHAFGSRRNGRPVGQFGTAEVFSLSPTKLLVAGEGGLVTTNDAVLAERIRAGRNYGDLGSYDPILLGLNARMPEFNAALALAGLDHFDRTLARYNQIAARYSSTLRGIPGICLQSIDSRDTTTYKDYTIWLNPTSGRRNRDQLAEALLAENIETKKYFYPPLHRQRLFRTFSSAGPQTLTRTDRVADGILSLPIYYALADDLVDTVANAVVELYVS
jgi:dTDP-4-amino-4,6-dideoxygalactose transaminase